KIHEELGDKLEISSVIGDIGSIYELQAKNLVDQTAKRDTLIAMALDHYLKALKLDEELGNQNGIAEHLGDIGSFYTRPGTYADAHTYLYKALGISTTIGSIDLIKDDYNLLSILY